jgi:hypothetical protein
MKIAITKKNRIIFLICLLGVFLSNIPYLKAQVSIYNQQSFDYQSTYDYISSMLTGEIPLSFKDAVFATEIAYYGEDIDIEYLNSEINFLVELVSVISNSDLVLYEKKDRDIILKHAAIFKVMSDSLIIPIDSTHVFLHTPYVYDFNDPFGQKDWSKMFVSKLLETGKGNCHSLPYLYKILADELNVPCYLAFAPNHIYIKLFSEETGWYNTELTNASFPIDAWIMASGYISLDAIRNGLYMDTLNTRQAVAHCLVDLAHGYQKKFGRENPEFVVKCCNTALEYHPVNVNAMLTKAEAQRYYIDRLMKKHNTKNPEDLFVDTAIAELYAEMEQTYVRLHRLGYRQMPERMYLEWMELLKEEPNTYINTGIKLTWEE